MAKSGGAVSTAAATRLVYTIGVIKWVWDNVLEVHSAAAGEPFLGCPDRDPTHFVELVKPWVGCVWELAPFGHERSAWVRHLLAPERPDLDGYLADFFPEGPAGGGD